MKNIIAILTVTILSLGMVAANPGSQKKTNLQTVTYQVNLNCDKCKARLEKHIPFEKGVKDMEVDVAEKKVTVTFDTRRSDSDAIARAIEKLGYTCVALE